MINRHIQRANAAFVGAFWAALAIGTLAYVSGLWNAPMALTEQGYYFTLLMYGLFAAVSLQKSVRGLLEGIAVTALYSACAGSRLGCACCCSRSGCATRCSRRAGQGFYAMAFLLSRFAAVAVQKNVRGIAPVEAGDAASGPPVDA